jgi:hypothetical protein
LAKAPDRELMTEFVAAIAAEEDIEDLLGVT